MSEHIQRRLAYPDIEADGDDKNRHEYRNEDEGEYEGDKEDEDGEDDEDRDDEAKANEGCTHRQPVAVRDFTYQGLDCEYFTLQHGCNPDELFGEAEELEFSSRYLNLDHEYGTSTISDYVAGAETGSPSTFHDSFTNLTSTNWSTRPEWSTEPTSIPFLDPARFEVGINADGVETRNLWPWGDSIYRPLCPHAYIDSEEYYAEKYLFTKFEEGMREQLTEWFAEQAILAGENAQAMKQREKWEEGEWEESEELERETLMSAPIVAFSQVVRGRTIYNP